MNSSARSVDSRDQEDSDRDDKEEYSDKEDYNELQGNSVTGFKREEDGNMVEVKPQRLEITADGALEERLLIRKEGWMYKKGGAVNKRGGVVGGGRTNWKNRWFVLTEVPFRGQKGYELRYYDRPKGALKGSVGLSEVAIYCESTISKDKKKRINLIKKFEFQLHLPSGGTLHLSCDNPDEREEWIETINIVIAYLRLLTHPELAMVINGYDPMNEEDADVYKQGDLIAQNCQCYGPGLFGAEAGQQGQIVLEVHDIEGEPVSRGGMPVTCTISNDNLLYYVGITDNENGSYSGYYTLSAPGKYKLSIRLNDEHEVFGSPYDIEILPSKTVASKSIAEGHCLQQIEPGYPTTFTIYACDNYGNRKTRGGDQFEVGIMGPAQLMSLHDNLDGSYVCTLEAQDPTTLNYYAPSSLMIVITLHGKSISGSPFRPVILDAQPGQISNTYEEPHVEVQNTWPQKGVHESAAHLAMASMLRGTEDISDALGDTHLYSHAHDGVMEESFVDDVPVVPPAKPFVTPATQPSVQSLPRSEPASVASTDKSANRLERARARANRAKEMLQ